MPISKNFGRQELIIADVDIALADLVSGADTAAVVLPVNAVVVGGDIIVTEAFNTAGTGATDVLDIGDATLQNRYLNDANVAALGRLVLVPTGFLATTAQPTVTVRWTGTGTTAATTGKLRLTVQYYVKGRAAFAQG